MSSFIFRLTFCFCLAISISNDLMAQKIGAAYLPPKTEVSDNYNLGTISAIAVHPTDPLTVYAGTSTNIYKTTDGGVIWNTVRLGQL